jgi:hypothetical protein
VKAARSKVRLKNLTTEAQRLTENSHGEGPSVFTVALLVSVVNPFFAIAQKQKYMGSGGGGYPLDA